MRVFLCAACIAILIFTAGCAGDQAAQNTPPAPENNAAQPSTTDNPATTGGDPMAAYYGNTIVSNGAQGGEVHIWYNADHTFTGKVLSFGMALKGTWELKEGTLCRNFDPPLPTVPNPQCAKFTPHELGERWHDKDRDNTLVAGVN